MRLPTFTNTLHFRLSALFLVLLSISAGAFWLWINTTFLSTDMAADEADWYDNKAEVELDSLALALGEEYSRNGELNDILFVYGQNVGRFEAEVIVFDAAGNYPGLSRDVRLCLHGV